MRTRIAVRSDESSVSELFLASYSELMAKDYDVGVLTAALSSVVRANPSLQHACGADGGQTLEDRAKELRTRQAYVLDQASRRTGERSATDHRETMGRASITHPREGDDSET